MSDLGARGGRIITGGRRAARRVKRVRLDDDDQRRLIVLEAALKLARTRGFLSFSWTDVAAACAVKTSISTARRSFESLVALRTAVAQRAESEGAIDVVEKAKQFGFLN